MLLGHYGKPLLKDPKQTPCRKITTPSMTKLGATGITLLPELAHYHTVNYSLVTEWEDTDITLKHLYLP